MKLEFNDFFSRRKKYLLLFYLLFFVFLNCKMKESNTDKISSITKSDTIAYQSNDTIDHSSEGEIIERNEYIAFLTNFINQKVEKQSIDTLNVKVEAAMKIYANDNAFKDEKFRDVNDALVTFIQNQNDLKVPESFYTAGLMESYGYFSIADGHPINHFKEGAKLGSVNCVKYLAIIYFERILYKHNATDLCDPVCMFHRGRNYIEETSSVSLNKSDILGFTAHSDNALLKTISDNINMKMSDDQILNYVTHLRTHYNPILELNDSQIQEVFNSLKTDLKSEDYKQTARAIANILENNSNISISDVAELYTYYYPAYHDDAKFLFWVTLDLHRKEINTYDQLIEDYDLDQKYGLTDFGSQKIYIGLLKYFIDQGDTKSEVLMQQYSANQ